MAAQRHLVYAPRSMIEDWVYGSILGLLHAGLIMLVYHVVPEPYMDEIFHVLQTRRYCALNTTWDPMITTPPALYVLAMPFCQHERYVNSVLIPIAYAGFCRYRRMFTGNHGDLVHTTALVALCLPVLLHSSVLFYTDLLGVCAVVWAFSTSKPSFSSVIFLIAICTRQTNIIWAAVYAAVRLAHRVEMNRPIVSVFRAIVSLWSFVLLGIGFIAFVIINGGIVLGDASAHAPQLHVVQALYFAAFAAIHAWPHVLSRLSMIISEAVRTRHAVMLISIVFAIRLFSLDHPYLLADNRHVPFYLWRWFLSKPTYRLTLAPAYLCSLLFLRDTSNNTSPLVRTLFSLATLLVLVPAHLIEPRYFITPFILWRLAANTTSRCTTFLEILSNLAVFSCLFYLFLFKPFEWSNEPGVPQRFMW